MVIRALVPALIVVAGTAHARSSDRPWVIDGDTVVWRGKHLRIANLDAPEIGNRARCTLERERGLAAKRYAVWLVRHGSSFQTYAFDHIDVYGRTVARLRINGRDFGSLMIAARVARPWRGRTSDWCR